MPLPNLANAVLLSAYVDTHGARCLDGTPQRYWLQTAVGINSTKWAIDFEGGAWCEDLASCASRMSANPSPDAPTLQLDSYNSFPAITL